MYACSALISRVIISETIYFRCNQFLDAMLHFMSLLPKLMNQQVDEDLRLREQSILVSMRAVTDGI